jgi:DNA-binding transcriptional LysR family regulator
VNLNHLAIFHAVALEKSVSLGAERLFISQPAVSKQLKELEEALGTKLFDRHSKGVRLTQSGEMLESYAQRIFGLEEEAQLALDEMRGLQKGRLTIGASLTIGGYLLPDIIVRYHVLYPGIDVNLEIANTDVIQRKLIDGALDLGFTEGHDAGPELDALVFSEDELVAIASSDHPIFSETPVSLARLVSERFVLREQGSGTRDVFERAVASKGYCVSCMISLGDIEAVKRAVAAGGGIGISSRHTIDSEVAIGKLKVIDVEDFHVRRPLHMLRLRGKYETLASRAFSKMIEGWFGE